MLSRASTPSLIFALSTLVACSGSEHQLGDQSGTGGSGRAGSPGSGGNAQGGKGAQTGGTSNGGSSSGGAVATGGASGGAGNGGTSGSGGHAGSAAGTGGEELFGLARDCVESGGKIALRRLCGNEFPDDCVSSCFPNNPGGVAGQSAVEGRACECPTDQCFKIYGLNGAVFGKCELKSNWGG